VVGALGSLRRVRNAFAIHPVPRYRLVNISAMRGAIVSGIGVVLIGLGAAPALRADTTYGPGVYTVPDELPYGTYAAHNRPGAYPGCIFTTKTSDGKVIDAYVGTFQDSLTAEILSPAIARFETSGCTPWVKVQLPFPSNNHGRD
jgi:hypothetical protein